jgi:hypothetical protein
MVTVQVGEVAKLAQAPPQPPKVEGEMGLAVRVTIAFSGKAKRQLVLLQLMPSGELVTVPVPVPLVFTTRVWLPGVVKIAETVWASVILTSQVNALPEHDPVQPPKTEGAVGFAVSVTELLFAKSNGHVELLQLIPAGELVTVPLPFAITVNVDDLWVKIQSPEAAAPVNKKQRRKMPASTQGGTNPGLSSSECNVCVSPLGRLT